MTIEELEAEIAPDTLADLRAAKVNAGRPLIAVDVDEVLVVFTDHLDRYIRTLGYEMRLEAYQLEGSIFPLGSADPVPFDGCIDLINRFFEVETERQEPIPGGADALADLSRDAQIVILTNVPKHGREGRRRNLDALGIPYPLIVNAGGKGRAMAWLTAHSGAPCAFVDDSVTQIGSVARRAPDVTRLHFAWAPFIRRLFPTCAEATCQVRDWEVARTELRSRLNLGATT